MPKITAILALGLALAGAGSALADDLAYTSAAAVLRSEPTTRSHVIASLARDTEVAVGDCHDRWCFAHVGDRTGYIAESLLDFDADTGRTVVERTYVEEPDYVYPDPYIVGGGIYFGCCHGGWHGGWHGYHGGFHGGYHHWHR